MISIAIDGPAGAGKSTLARRLASQLAYIYVDTGAMYRTVALYAIRNGVQPSDEAKVSALLCDVKIKIKYIDEAQHIFLGEEDVSEAIRAEQVSMGASAVAAHKAVREFLLSSQREIAKGSNVIMDGRDIGTVVLPNATVKIYLTATEEARAKRRTDELICKGMEADYNKVLEDVKKRDYDDTNRAIAPLKQAQDAVLVDTTMLDFEGSYELLLKTIKERI